MGLGKVTESNGLYLSIAGGFIWDRKADKSHPEFAIQTFDRVDGTEGERSGARYAELTGMVTDVEFRTHEKYGESINVKVTSGEDQFILSISTNNRYSQDMMKALLKIDVNKEVYLKPYDFTDTKTNKRVQGISFRQDGEKIDLKTETPDEFQKKKDWFDNANKKQIKRYFEDLSDWFVSEVEEKVRPLFAGQEKEQEKETEEVETKPQKTETKEEAAKVEETAKETQEPAAPKMTPLKMKKALKEYIDENYEGQELPKLGKEQLKVWYDLSVSMEELPFEDDSNAGAEVDEDDIQAQLDALAGN